MFHLIIHTPIRSFFFFFNDTATTEIYTLSLHDALPISARNSTMRAAICAPTSASSPSSACTCPRAPAARSASKRNSASWRNFCRICKSCRNSDRKSTRLNSSHDQISYAVFCLKKKKMQQSSTTLFSLPGVPSEMRAIFRASIIPHLESFHTTRPKEVEIKITGIIESALAPIHDQARKLYPKLYFKSHPRGRETGIRPLILLHIYNVEPGAEKEISEASARIMLQLAGIRARSSLIMKK